MAFNAASVAAWSGPACTFIEIVQDVGVKVVIHIENRPRVIAYHLLRRGFQLVGDIMACDEKRGSDIRLDGHAGSNSCTD